MDCPRCKIQVIRCVSKEKVFYNYKCSNNFSMRVARCIITAFVDVDLVFLCVLMSQKDNTYGYYWCEDARAKRPHLFARRIRGWCGHSCYSIFRAAPLKCI